MKVLIYSAGNAGEDLTDAFRRARADVVGIVGRTTTVVSTVASKIHIAYSSTNWLEALTTCKPDIVHLN